ncbi:MAG: hypothetical protein HKN45_10620 [Flavobacteriales bacterium]|nr:hypothetical protein [Flavobacteriales bacterium]
MKRALVFGVIIIGIAAAIFTSQMYFEGPRDLRHEKSEISLTAEALFEAYNTDEQNANSEYLDKVIAVQGSIKSIDSLPSPSISLQTNDLISNIVCELAEGQNLNQFKPGHVVTVKGQCTGFLSDVILVKCVIIKP